MKKILPFSQDSTRTGYELIHANTTDKFLVLELTRATDPNAKSKPPLISKDDYVILFRRDVSFSIILDIGT